MNPVNSAKLPKARYPLLVYANPEELRQDTRLSALAEQIAPRYDAARGLFELEFLDRKSRDEFLNGLLQARILSSTSPLPSKTAKQWKIWMTGEASAVSFNLLACFFGPFWYLFRNLTTKFWIYLSILLWLAAAENMRSQFPLPALLHGLVVMGFFACWLYSLLYANYDLFLARIRRESLWPAFPYGRYKALGWLLVASGIVAAGLTAPVSKSGGVTISLPINGRDETVAGFTRTFSSPFLLNLVGKSGAIRASSEWEKVMSAKRPVVINRLTTMNHFRFTFPQSLLCLETLPGNVVTQFPEYPKPFEGEVGNFTCFLMSLGADGALLSAAPQAVITLGQNFHPNPAMKAAFRTIYPGMSFEGSYPGGPIPAGFERQEVLSHVELNRTGATASQKIFTDYFWVRTPDQGDIGFFVSYPSNREEEIQSLFSAALHSVERIAQ